MSNRSLTSRDLDLIQELQCANARQNFWLFRCMMDPDMIKGWWQFEVARELQKFYHDIMAGRTPKLILQAPPQHGKSRQIIDFIAWLAGKNPELKSLYASYSSDLGEIANLSLQRMMRSERYLSVFGKTRIGQSGWQCNTQIIEYPDHRGSFRNTTVDGQITGKELDLGFIDDPIKGRKEANSKIVRDGIWSWFTDDFFSRFSKHASLLMIMTRWHLDDPAGRFHEKFPEVRMLRYPAIADKDERHRKKGEALFPEHKPLAFLEERKRLLTKGSWEALYQQSPIFVGGGLFPIEKFKRLPANMLDRKEIVRSVRYWDKAGTEDGGAYTAGVKMHAMSNGTFVVEHVVHGQWEALKREREIKLWAEHDGAGVQVWVEQEPGSSGKESAENTIRMLSGFRAFADRVTGNKEYRAEPYAAQVQGGNVYLVGGNWVSSYLDEAEAFPSGKYKDQIDASSGAFNKLVGSEYGYDESGRWIDG